MKDRETELLERWRAERPMYAAWGDFVSEMLTEAVAREIHPANVELFFRIPLKPRTKEEPSLLAKAFHRGKQYKDPYDDIEDKVGVRIVVLFSEDIRVVERTITTCDRWTAAKARDFEEERAAKPFEFDYQSLHYIVRAKASVIHGGVDVAVNTPCEVQVRTILQHAYSELTHDTIYKPSIQAEPHVKRAAAKSMALIEATDDYFTQVRQKLELAQAPSRQIAAAVQAAYKPFTGLEPQPSPLNTLLVDHFCGWAKEGFEAELDAFLKEKPFLAERIQERATKELLYRQPAVLLVYWAIKQAPRSAPLNSPLSDDELAPLYGDLGLKSPGASA
ncbi:GTP pyrophosphokinase [Caulobacter endophyticus]|uniref:RelA/SpoT family protein n=1 Tax=Caulobacter endophyticus TaxID=2172652 RepID=A0A2T9K2S0_9CAUL|nr:RelA/SpoT family protein [Caulobacter endophyticus]PVM90111.1 RelA/SpoT family protein [Caulobacter endophyticus]